MAIPLTARPSGTWLMRTPPFLPVIMAILLVWASIAAHLVQEHRQDEQAAIENTSNLARGFGENVNRTIEGVEQVMMILRNAYRHDPASFSLADLVPANDVLNGLTLQISAVDAHGIMTSGNLPIEGRVDLSDRDHIKVHFNTDRDELYISRPVLGRVSKKWSLQFTRKLFGPDGKFAGVLVISLDPYFMSRFYESLSIGKGAITLVGVADGVVRARAPNVAEVIGSTMSPSTLVRLRGPAASGSFQWISRVDGTERLFSYRKLDKNGLAVIVGLATDEVFATFQDDLRTYVVVGSGLTVLISLVGLVLVHQRRRLIASQHWLSAAMENISQGILLVEADGSVPIINQRAASLLELPGGLLHAGLQHRDILDWQLAHREYSPKGQDAPDLEMAGTERTLATNFYERTRPNGTELEVRTQLLPEGGAVRTFTDITERKHTEKALAAARDVAEAASKARSDFLAMVSHEIRTPLNGVIGMAGLLLDSELGAKQRHYAETLRDAADNLLRIINDILDFSKLEANRLEIETIPFDLPHVINSVTGLLEQKAAGKGLWLRSEVSAELPRRLLGDPGRLRQILLNLVDNGLKFTRNGGVAIEVRLVNNKDGRVRIGFAVRDTGIGIPLESQATLFQHFAQVDSSISRRFGGTGLGLAISRRLVGQMGGRISVASRVGEGTEFNFDIELEIDPNASAALPRRRRGSGGVPHGVPVRRLRILLAEDNATNQMVAIAWLEAMGHRVDAVASGEEAIEAVATVPYDLVLMDVMMPDTDGLAATQVIRAMPGSVRNIPIVAVTANVFDQHRQACLDVGMDAVLGKPFTTDELTSVIDRAIAGTLRAPLEAPPALDGAVFTALSDDLGPEGAGMLLRTMMLEANERLAAIRACFAIDDWEGLLREAHALRAAAATVGLSALEQCAEHLAQMPRTDSARALDQLEEAWGVAQSAVEQQHPGDSVSSAEA